MRASTTLHAGLAEPLLDLVAQVRVDLVAVAAQRRLPVVVRVVRIALRHLAQRGFGLDLHEVFVVVDAEHGFGRVDHLPDDDGGDLDRIAVDCR